MNAGSEDGGSTTVDTEKMLVSFVDQVSGGDSPLL